MEFLDKPIKSSRPDDFLKDTEMLALNFDRMSSFLQEILDDFEFAHAGGGFNTQFDDEMAEIAINIEREVSRWNDLILPKWLKKYGIE